MAYQVWTHPGECPECLGENLWPSSGFTQVREDHPADDVEHADIKAYAQSLLDFLVLWLTGNFHIWDKTGKEFKFLSEGDEYRHLKKVLQIYHTEILCKLCDRTSVFGRPCSACKDKVHTQNTTRQCRMDIAQEVFNSNYKSDISIGMWRADVAGLASATQVRPRNPAHRLVNHSWPWLDSQMRARQTYGVECSLDLMDEMKKVINTQEEAASLAGLYDNAPAPWEAPNANEIQTYTKASEQVLEAATWLLAYDTGVAWASFPRIMAYLGECLQHPDSKSGPFSWNGDSTLSFGYYTTIMLTYARRLKDPAQDIDIMTNLLSVRLAEARSAHLEEMNDRKGQLIFNRMNKYTSRVLGGTISPGWRCAVCHEKDTGNPPSGQVVRLDRCGHMFHLKCMRNCVLVRLHGNRQCPLCRRNFDSIDTLGGDS